MKKSARWIWRKNHYFFILSFSLFISSAVYSQFTPTDITGLSLWLKPELGIDTLPTGEVTQWRDQSALGNDALQPSSSLQPKITLGFPELNGYKTVYFDGASDYMSFMQPLPLMTTSQTINIFSVLIPDLSGRRNNYGGGGLLGEHPGSDVAGSWYAGIRGTGEMVINFNTIPGNDPNGRVVLSNPLVNDQNPMLAEWIGDTTVPTIFNNGQTSSPQVSGSQAGWGTNNGDLGRGIAGDPPSLYKGNIAEVLVYSGLMADSNRIKVEQYLRFKYAPPVNLGTDIVSNYFCDTTLNASARFTSYLWSTGATTQTIAVNQAGTYSVVVTDVFGYTSSDAINVTYTGNFSPFPGNVTTICSGSSVTWSTNLIPASSYTFAWSNGATTSAINITQAGQYSVTVTDGLGCTRASNTLTVTVDNFSQPQAVVSLGPDVSMCSGGSIALTNGAGQATSYQWSTGATTPSIVITTTGLSTYTLTVQNAGGCIATDTITVNVKGIAPNISFASAPVCLGGASIFADATTVPTPDSIATWSWSFGDGGIASVQNPSHSYTASGTYTASLTVVSDSGCVNTGEAIVTVYELPVAGFSTSAIPEGCNNISYTFNDTSVVNPPDILASWLWDFGDGENSALSTAQHTYTLSGNYSVSLTATTDKGCANQVIKILTINATDTLPLQFSLQYPGINAIVADNPLVFQWFPSSYSSQYTLELSLDSFTTVYARYGGLVSVLKSVSGLTMGLDYFWRVKTYNSCSDSIVSEIMKFTLFAPTSIPGLSLWLKPEIGIDTLPTGEVTQWRDQSALGNDALQLSGSLQPKITFGFPELNGYKTVFFDGTNDYMSFMQPLPLMTTSQSVNIFSVLIPDLSGRNSIYGGGGLLGEHPGSDVAGSWYVGIRGNGEMAINYNTIPGSDPAGRIILSSPLVNDQKPLLAEWIGDTTVPTIFNNGQPGSQQVTGSQSGWGTNNGDLGRGLAGDAASLYKGNIAEVLVYTGVMQDSTRLKIEQYLHYKYAPPVNLGSDIALNYFCDTTLNASARFTSYVWSTGATTQTIAVNQLGSYSVTVTDVFGFTSSDIVNVNYPAIFSPFPGNATTICSGSSVAWNTNLDPAQYTFAWSNGATTSAINITQAGQYSVTVTDGLGCTRTSNTLTVTVDNFSQPQAIVSLGPDVSMCSGGSIALTSGAGEATSYLWLPGGETTPSIVITATGFSTYTLSVQNAGGCSVTDTIMVNVKGVAPNAGFVAAPVCFGSASGFTDVTTVPAPDSIATWSWDFGDGSPVVIGAQNPAHTYSASGSYSVILSVVSDSGCPAAIQNTVVVNAKPNASINVATSPSCTNASTQFTDASTISSGSMVSWTWDLGDGSALDNSKNTSHTYTAAGTYTVQHIVTSALGCKDTFVSTVTVFQSPAASFTTDTVCKGSATSFTDNSAGASGWVWNFGDGANSTLQNASHSYSLAGAYNATLLATSSNGCVNSVSDSVIVNHLPVPDFSGDSVCVNAVLQFTDSSTVNGSTVNAWYWQFGTGDTSAQQNPGATYSASGTYSVTLLATSAQGCTAAVTHTVSVQPLPVSSFSFTPAYSYPQAQVSFSDLSSGGASYQWFFGDGAQDTGKYTAHTYTSTGTFFILLVTQSAFGCIDSSVQQIPIDIPLLDISVNYLLATNSSGVISVSAFLENMGTLDATSIELSTSLDDGTPVHEFWTGFKKPGDFFPYLFNSSFELVSNKHSIVCVEVKKVNGQSDDVSSNNKKCTAITDEFVLLNPFPNPTIGEIYFLFVSPDASAVKAQIIDTRGRVVATPFDATASKGLNQISYNTILLEKGMYVIKLTYKDKVITKVFVKE